MGCTEIRLLDLCRQSPGPRSEHEPQAAELKSELTKLREGSWLIVQEVVPELENAWLAGSRGSFYSEFVISMVLAKGGFAPVESQAHPAEPAVSLETEEIRRPRLLHRLF